MENPESVGSGNPYSRINDCMKLSNLRVSKKSLGFETSQNSKKDDRLSTCATSGVESTEIENSLISVFQRQQMPACVIL
jgi:hypothetical protein